MRLTLLLLLLAACESPQADEAARQPEPPASVSPADVVEVDSVGIGQTIYVPVYSHIYYHDDRRVINLAATLSVRNTDRSRPITIRSVRYYDSAGVLVRTYLNEPLRLPPLASKDYVVEEDDTSGGSGANFIVEWSAAAPVTDPVVEAVMISAASSQGISFVSAGRVIEEHGGGEDRE